MNFIRGVIEQPVTVAVGVILTVMAGIIALQRIPIQLTPNVEDTIISVRTTWEGASPEEVEREIIEEQEEKLQGIANLRAMTSESQQGTGAIRLEFAVGTSKDVALREVSDKLREVPDYPDNVDEPVIEASDPENRDFIAWIVFSTTDPNFDIRTLQDFAEDRIKPQLERVEGMAEVNVLGGREREVQIQYDPVALANYGISPTEFAAAITQTNRNISGGELADAKRDVRLRTISQYSSVEDVERTVIRYDESGGPIYIGDVADVQETYKELRTFVRSRGRPVVAINAQKEVGANVMVVMAGLKEVVANINTKGGLLESEARRLNLNGTLNLEQVYDQTIYIDDALALVQSNIWFGGALAILTLLIFLRSVRAVGIIALAIPISVIGAVVAMVALGRTVNVVSLAGMAFAVGMVVDNAIVVLENTFRHLEMGKSPMRAAYDGAREVWGAVLASTLTTVFVFVPILLIQEEAGQLFRDIALAICAAVMLSLIVSITVIPTAAARLLKPVEQREKKTPKRRSGFAKVLMAPVAIAAGFGRFLHTIPDRVAKFIYWACGSVLIRVVVVAGLTIVSILGSWWLMPPSDYLPTGNRNLVFGLLIPPPGYNMNQQQILADRIQETVEPYYQAGKFELGTPEYEQAKANLPEVPTFNWFTQSAGDPVTPPPLENYFIVSFDGMMFHGGISKEPDKVVDVMPLFAQATRSEVAPGVLAFAFQVPLFRLGGRTGAAIKVDLSGDDLTKVTNAGTAVYNALGQKYGYGSVQPSPSNFNIFGPELQVIPDKRALADVGLTPTDLGLAAQAGGDGAIIGDYRIAGDTIDLKIITQDAVDRDFIGNIEDTPIATPAGPIVPLSSLASFVRTTSPPQINHVGRQRSVTLQFTPPVGLALEQAVDEIQATIDSYRELGMIPPDVSSHFAGSASKLESVQRALLGDGSVLGTLFSAMVLALAVVYLLMCILFQSFLRPLVIMFSVPLALLGGFLALRIVFIWSAMDRYMPLQMLDVLTMLGFVILIGIVVNNAILIVHQSINFMKGVGDVGDIDSEPMPPRRAIAESVRTRVRPIMMSTLTSVLGMLPLVVMPGSGSELYRGLGAVVLGGLMVSTIFTIFLVPLLFSLVTDFQMAIGKLPESRYFAPKDDRGSDFDADPSTGRGRAGAASPALINRAPRG